MDYSPPGSSVNGIFQVRTLEWSAISFSSGSAQSRDQTQVSCIAGRFSTSWATSQEAGKVRLWQSKISWLSWPVTNQESSPETGYTGISKQLESFHFRKRWPDGGWADNSQWPSRMLLFLFYGPLIPDTMISMCSILSTQEFIEFKPMKNWIKWLIKDPSCLIDKLAKLIANVLEAL